MNCPDCGERLHCSTVEHPSPWMTIRYLKCLRGCNKNFKEISYLEGYGPAIISNVQKVAILADLEKSDAINSRIREFVNPPRI